MPIRKKWPWSLQKLLNDEAKSLCEAGIDIIQFDEPAFNSFLKESTEWGMDAMEMAIDGLDCKTAVHICYGYGIEENLNWKKHWAINGGNMKNFSPPSIRAILIKSHSNLQAPKSR